MSLINKTSARVGWRLRWLVTILLGVLSGWLAEQTWMRELEWKTENTRLQVRERLAATPPHAALMLVEADEASVQATGRWPWPRPLHGMLMQSIGGHREALPRVLTWDILFVDADLNPDNDSMFAGQLAEVPYPMVFGAVTDPSFQGVKSYGAFRPHFPALAAVKGDTALARLPDKGGALMPMADFLAAARPAFLDAESDSDGVVRRVPLVFRVGDQVFPSLVLQTLLSYWRLGPENVTIVPGEAVVIRDQAAKVLARVPINADGVYTINYRYELSDGPKGAAYLPCIGYQRLFAAATAEPLTEEHREVLRSITDRILFVGQTATGMTDIGPSPLRGQSPKVLVHLNALDNILKGDYLRTWLLWPGLVLMLLLGMGLAWVLERFGYGWHAALVPLALAGLIAGAVGLLCYENVLVPLALPLGAFVVQQGLVLTLKIREERAQRERVKGMFGAYVSPALVQRMIESGEEPKLGGVEEVITAYFSDIEGFSGFSEKLTPPQLVELMNEYLTACTDIVQAEGGTLDKYIGDALVAMYGAPLALPAHAHAAVVAALRVQKRGLELRQKWKHEPEKNWPEIVTRLQTRIGLNTGRAVVGNMGSHTRFNYTMMGDTVNLAARMESGAKAYGVYTMITEATRAESARVAPGAVLFRRLDRIVVKGRSQAVEIHEAVALAADVTPAMRECVEWFERGLEFYWMQDWAEAAACFQASLRCESHAGHSPSDVLLERVALMRAKPPGPDWDGVWRMTSK
ncbi:MAG: adenylate/guanylate cyclase domain-containing protein [Verrucomicrobia bacterium]|nr:adenylate/guanylate cyclase domain-containing protein [Verrucomicrobiota bacterium]